MQYIIYPTTKGEVRRPPASSKYALVTQEPPSYTYYRFKLVTT